VTKFNTISGLQDCQLVGGAWRVSWHISTNHGVGYNVNEIMTVLSLSNYFHRSQSLTLTVMIRIFRFAYLRFKKGLYPHVNLSPLSFLPPHAWSSEQGEHDQWLLP